MRLANTSLQKAAQAETSGNVTLAITEYVNALKLSATANKGELLRSQITSSLKTLIQGLETEEVSGNHQKGTIGSELLKPLVVRAFVKKEGKEIPVSNIPVRFEFKEGKGELTETVKTTETGIASLNVSKIEHRGSNIVESSIDVAQITPSLSDIERENLQVLLSIIDDLKVKNVSFYFEAITPSRGFKVSLSIYEMNFGETCIASYLKNALSDNLTNNGYTIAQGGKADILIEGNTTTRFERDNQGLYFSAYK